MANNVVYVSTKYLLVGAAKSATNTWLKSQALILVGDWKTILICNGITVHELEESELAS